MTFTRALAALAGVFVLVAWFANGSLAQSEGVVNGKTTEEVYKNIEVLKGIPADLLPPTMQFVAASLGQHCTFCHVRDAFEKDDKKEKRTARRMMQMVLAINRDNFEGRTEVTCYTCHRGHESPVRTPILSDSEPAAGLARELPEGGARRAQRPSAGQLLDRFVSAMGGAEALSKIASRFATGTVLARDGGRITVEMYSRGTDERVLITHTAKGDRSVGYTVNAGWILDPERGLHDMSSYDLEGARLENDLYLATHAQQIYTKWRLRRSEMIGDREAYALNGTAEGRAPLRLYLDRQTGLLLRVIHFTVTPLGRLPAQVDFADYRKLDGVEVPYRMTMTGRNSSTRVQFDRVQQNVPIEDSKFAKPSAAGR